MCNPTLVVAAASSALQYQQSVQAQKAQRDAALRQNEIANKNLQNKLKTVADYSVRESLFSNNCYKNISDSYV